MVHHISRVFLLSGIWLILGSSIPVVAQPDGPPGNFVQVISHQNLDFGVSAQGEGAVNKYATDQAIGKFEIWAQLPPNKQVTITIEPPEHFLSGSDKVPYQIRASYNAHADDPSTATDISGLTATFSPQANPTYNHPPPPFPEASAYIYIYGTATVGYQPSGTYSAPITVEAKMSN